MNRISVRDIRLKWPQVERQLAHATELVVTRDAVPVARLLPYRPAAAARRARFDAASHRRWLRRFWQGQTARVSTDALLQHDRAE